MTPDRDAILKALENVIDPELQRPVTELDMVRDIEIDGGDVSVTIALTVAGCPLRESFQSQVVEHVGKVPGVERVRLGFDVMSPEERSALSVKLRGGVESAQQGHLRRPGDARARDRERQGRRRQVVADREPRRRVLGPRPPHRRPRRRHLRPLDPAHARRHPAAGRRRQDDRPARQGRPEADVDRLLPRRQRARDVAWADAPPGARAVPVRRPLGRARPAARRHAARDR